VNTKPRCLSFQVLPSAAVGASGAAATKDPNPISPAAAFFA
jgi:hypothetical protein